MNTILPITAVCTPTSLASHGDQITGILYPTVSSLVNPASSAISPLVDGQTVAGLAGGSSGVLAFFRNKIPWGPVAQWTHHLERTPTGQWMDFIDGAVRGPYHRWLHHHPYDFAKAWWSQATQGELSWFDYFRHGFLDCITVNGIPLLPEAVHAKLVSLGIPAGFLFHWTHVNLFDVAIGSLSLVDGGSVLVMAICGHLPWGVKTLLLTFGVGTLNVVAGLATENPLLVCGGALRIAAGGVSLWQHIHLPQQSLISTLLPGLLGGATAGVVVTATRLALAWKTTSPEEKILLAAESIGLSTLLGTLSVLSPWLSVPLGVAYSVGKLAFSVARTSDQIWEKTLISSDFTQVLSEAALLRHGGSEAVESLRNYLGRMRQWPVDPKVSSYLANSPDWGLPPPGTEHVFGERGKHTF